MAVTDTAVTETLGTEIRSTEILSPEDRHRATGYDDLVARIEALEAASAGAVKQTNKLTIIAWGGDLDRIWPTTILATTAAASGMESSVFFTFWGLFAIVKPDVRITGDNWMQKMMSAMNPGSAQKAKLSRYHFAGAGPTMFKKLADDRRVAKPETLIATAQDLGVRLIPCQMTMDLLGLKPADLLDGLEEPIGAATAIAEMREAAVSLFI
jgi:peroxiredoxin family protein